MRNTNEMQSSGSALRGKPLARLNTMTSMVTPTPKKLKVDAKGNSSSTYSRKKKSLGVLAENFLNHYKDKPRGSVIIVDNAAVDLGVERRRIYDVVNILESISLVEKKQKNTYSWMGMDHLDGMFCDLQAKAILDYPQDAKKHLGLEDETENTLSSNQLNHYHQHSKKENKSLAKLSQEFLQVFLVGFGTLSLPEASDKIQGTTSMAELVAMGGGARVKATEAEGDTPIPGPEPGLEPDAREIKAAAARGLKTKIRRLYDIANVFLSVGLLKKVDNVDTSRRPNFAWSYKLSARDLYKLHQKSMQMQSLVTPLYTTSTYTENTGLVKARIHENIPSAHMN
jgi:transcription factor E2F7/8